MARTPTLLLVRDSLDLDNILGLTYFVRRRGRNASTSRQQDPPASAYPPARS